MNILGIGSEKKEFMTFQAYGSIDFSGDPIETYQVMINPDQFSVSMSASYNSESVKSKSVSLGRFSNMSPIDYSCTLMLDGTGVVPTNKEKKTVKDQLSQLSRVFFKELNAGKEYKPNYVRITYCDEIFDCRITSYKIDYTLFNADGTPLRAKVTCSFQSACVKDPKKDEESDSGDKGGAPASFLDGLAEAFDSALDTLFKLSI